MEISAYFQVINPPDASFLLTKTTVFFPLRVSSIMLLRVPVLFESHSMKPISAFSAIATSLAVKNALVPAWFSGSVDFSYGPITGVVPGSAPRTKNRYVRCPAISQNLLNSLIDALGVADDNSEIG
ncbi:hypothetical protein CDO26_21860 (plasmid) [Sinorhizobium meliloti]|nr:hypothetical protein CDO26_21860 [Sinorhizobium meliloti]